MSDSKFNKATIWYDYYFNEIELNELYQKMADQLAEQEQNEAGKKSAMATWKAKIEETTAALSSTKTKVQQKKEPRQIEANIEFDFKTKQRIYVHPETLAVLKKEPLHDIDYQRELPICEK